MIPLERPLVFLDAEATGVDTEQDRVCELTLSRFEPGGAGAPEIRSRLINPTVPIPPEATAVHGITDGDVAGEPTFSQLSASLLELLTDVDFGGYNIVGYDLPLLEAEFRRCGLAFEWQQRACVDGFAILSRQEPRDLQSVYRRMFGDEAGEELDWHRSEADVAAAIAVVGKQVLQYGLHSAAELDAGGRRPEWADRQGKLHVSDAGELVFGFGKHFGKPVESQIGYLRWMLAQEFPTDTVALIRPIVAAYEAAKR